MTLVVLAVLAWWMSPPSTLEDLARRERWRREHSPASARAFTDQDVAALPSRALPSIPQPADLERNASEPDALAKSAQPPDLTEGAVPAGRKDEAWWQARITSARALLERDQLLTDAVQTRINSLTNDVASRHDPARRALLIDERARSLIELDRLKKAVDADRKAIDDITERARKEGVPPGWVRGAF